MRICIPVQTNEGLKATVDRHFGSASYFLIYDSNTEAFEVISNDTSVISTACATR